LPEVVQALLRPLAASARSVGTTKVGLEQDGRDLGLELRRLVEGDLAGMFDGPTTPGMDPGSGVLVIDLSAVYHSEALGALMVCASAWLQAMTARASAQTILVIDEAWAVLTDLAVARYLRSSWKLARSNGLANVAVCHRASDLGASGAAGSEQSRLAEGLLADSETVVCYAQPASELPALAGLLGCSQEELEILPRLRRGVALWVVGRRRFLVEHLLGPDELAVVDTDSRLLREPPGATQPQHDAVDRSGN
jgi:type IV secretory pathway VirB4 component